MLIKHCRVGTLNTTVSDTSRFSVLLTNFVSFQVIRRMHISQLYLLISGKGTLERKISMSEIYIWREMFQWGIRYGAASNIINVATITALIIICSRVNFMLSTIIYGGVMDIAYI